MQDKMIESFNEQTRQFFEPMRKLNSLMLDNMEKMTQYQMESMKRYSQLGTERLRDASEVSDAEGLKDFSSRQAEMMSELSQQMLADAKALSEMSLAFKAELEKLFAEQTRLAEQAASQAADGETPKGSPAKATSQSSRGGSKS
ncbi:MAG: phasin family protein [Halomonas sp.]